MDVIGGGNNHYSDQMSNLFPITLDTLIFGGLGCLIYLAFLIINTGCMLTGILKSEENSANEKDRIRRFTVVSAIVLVIEIVFMIVLTEQGVGTIPHKFLFRYFQIFVPPMLIFWVKKGKESICRSFKETLFLSEASFLIATVYFITMHGNTKQAIMDGHAFLLIENLTKYVFPYADAVVMITLMITEIVIFCVLKGNSEHSKHMMKICFRGGGVGTALLWTVVALELPFYNNIIAGGRQIEHDSIVIAEYLNKGAYDRVYYVYDEEKHTKGSYLRNFYGYIKQEYYVIEEREIDALVNKRDEKAALLCPADLQLNEKKFSQANLDNEVLFLYTIR